MANLSGGEERKKATPAGAGGDIMSAEHYIRVLLHRKWLILSCFVVVSAVTFVVSAQLPNIYTSETVILVDPQKVPESYVKATVTGDVRNRLGTLSAQVLSATRLQKIIETLNLYPEERKTLAREELLAKMRKDINVKVVNELATSQTQDLQAFRISYSGGNNRVVAQVTNEIASLFIEENLKAREQQATGTTEFLENQLQETRKALEEQETKLKDFKLQHIGEMPEQQAADLQILGQLQSQFQLQGDALSRAEQQKTYLQNMSAQVAPVVDVDDAADQGGPNVGETKPPTPQPKPRISAAKAKLATLLNRYTDEHPDVRRLKKLTEEEEAKAAAEAAAEPAIADAAPDTVASGGGESVLPVTSARRAQPQPVNHFNPVLQAQMESLNAEIATHKEELQRLAKSISSYQGKLSAIPIREQEITHLVRDYEISKAHYSQLLDKQLSAETATQLEIRQKGEKFEVLDPGQPAGSPSSPNRPLINAAGGLGGLFVGMLLAISTEFLGMSITSPQALTSVSGLAVLEVIPVIQTATDRQIRKRRIFVTAASAAAITVVSGAIFLIRNLI